MSLIALQGRIVVYQVRDNKLHQVCEKETKGSVFCLADFQARAVARPAVSLGPSAWLHITSGMASHHGPS